VALLFYSISLSLCTKQIEVIPKPLSSNGNSVNPIQGC